MRNSNDKQEVSCSFYCVLWYLLNCKTEPYSPPIPSYIVQQSWAQLHKTQPVHCLTKLSLCTNTICSCMQKNLVFNKLHTISCIYTSPMFSCIAIDALLPSGVWRCSKHLCCMDEFTLPWKVSWEKSNCNNFFSTSKEFFLLSGAYSKIPEEQCLGMMWSGGDYLVQVNTMDSPYWLISKIFVPFSDVPCALQ